MATPFAGPARFIDYLRLFRAGNVFTALADILMGFLVVHRQFQPVGPLVSLLLASALLYTAGMVLNDVFDVEQDRRERPQRPLPSGRISLRTAWTMGVGMLLVGMGAALAGGYLFPQPGVPAWRAGAVALALAMTILLYDGALKKTFAGPLLMGSCRLLNVLLGMSLAVPATHPQAFLGFTLPQWLAAGGIGIYIVGVTAFARSEAATSRKWVLWTGLAIMMSGIGMLALLDGRGSWYLLLGLIAFTILRQGTFAVYDPRPQRVQLAVKHAIFSLVVLDAAVALLYAGPVPGLIVLSLLVPTLLVGRVVYAT